MAAHLSPLDPMMFAIHGSRTFALLRLGKSEEAAEFAGLLDSKGRSCSRTCSGRTDAWTAGRIEEAHAARRRIRVLRPDYNFGQFEDAFHLLDDLRRIYQKAAKLVLIPNEA